MIIFISINIDQIKMFLVKLLRKLFNTSGILFIHLLIFLNNNEMIYAYKFVYARVCMWIKITLYVIS